MNEFGVAQWYQVLVRGKELTFAGDWILYQSSPLTVELIRHDGDMCRAVVEEDGVARVRGEGIPLPPEVVNKLQCMLNLS